MPLKMDKPLLQRFLIEEFPQVCDDFVVETVWEMGLRLRLIAGEHHLRPGGTVSGPAMFGLADVGVYLSIMAMIGPKALAVTTNSAMDFMRKPAAGRDLLAEVRLLKLGRVLAVGDALLFSEGQTTAVARASLTYSIPPERDGVSNPLRA